jgi:hypothetical protein
MPTVHPKDGPCERCGFRSPRLLYDTVTQKDLCPSCLKFLEGRRAVLRGRMGRGKLSEGMGDDTPCA